MSVVRHVGKRTSGRYVYKVRTGWYWQCDLHEKEGDYEYGKVVPTMQEAFEGALEHVEICGRTND